MLINAFTAIEKDRLEGYDDARLCREAGWGVMDAGLEVRMKSNKSRCYSISV